MTNLGLSKRLLEAALKEGYTQPTPVQERVIPLALERRDVLAKAQTGSGKTASFALPVLELWAKSFGEGKPKIKALVLTPTRELTAQVARAFETLGASLPKRPKVVSIVGGEGIGEQLFALQKGCDIVVATSGRLLDILDKKQINLSHLEFFILDEADKMLDMGFAAELDLILASIPTKRQNMLFSATYPPKVLEVASKITQNPITVEIEAQQPTVESIAQRVIEVSHENRSPLLRHLLTSENWDSALVFMASKRATENISAKFRKYGFKAYSFHGDLEQDERRHTLEEFKKRKIRILFATDIAARGLDIEGLECVINFDLPRAPADYIHRIGRTGRAGKSGVAVSFISHEDKEHFALIEKRCGVKIERESIEGFELTGEVAPKPQGNEPVKGKRKSKKRQGERSRRTKQGTKMNFNTMSDEAKTLIHARLTECVNAFGGASHFYQLLEAIRAAKPNPLLAKNCVFGFELGTIKWSKAIFEDKLNLLVKARLFESKRDNLLPKEDDQAFKRALNLVRALKPIEFKVKPKNIKHGEGFTVMPFEVIDETTTRMDPIFDILFFAGIDTAKKILKYTPATEKNENK